MSRDVSLRPVPAVSGVVFRGEEVLLIRRKAAPYAGLWSLPGGAVEAGESMHQAVTREVREETGLEVRPLHLVGAYDSIVEEEGEIRFHYVLVDFLCELLGGTIRPASDASEAEWVPLTDLDAKELTPLARRAIVDAIRIQGNGAEER